MQAAIDHWKYLKNTYVSVFGQTVFGGTSVVIGSGIVIDPEAIAVALTGVFTGWAAEYMDTIAQMNILASAMYAQNCIYSNDGTWPITTSMGTNGVAGTQYIVGDYTGGQTVDFHTGIGTGNPSVCGSATRVIKVVLEVFDDQGYLVNSIEGYATTC
jgi:hypothetical protein